MQNVLAPVFDLGSLADGCQQVIDVIADLQQASSRVLKMGLVTLTSQFGTAELLQCLLHWTHLLLALNVTNTNS